MEVARELLFAASFVIVRQVVWCQSVPRVLISAEIGVNLKRCSRKKRTSDSIGVDVSSSFCF